VNRLSRALLAAATVTAVSLTGASVETALAKPHASHGGQAAHAAGHGKAGVAKSDARKVLRDIARVTAKLDRAVRPARIDGLDEGLAVGTQDALLANVEADKAGLATLATTVSTAGDTTDLRQARRDLRDLREENYVLVVNVLRHAAHVKEAAADDAEALALVDSAVAKALLVTAASTKADVKAARADLVAAQALLDDDADADDDADVTATEPETDPSVPAA